MKKFTFFFVIAFSSLIFSQDISNTLGIGGVFIVRNSAYSPIFQSNLTTTSIYGNNINMVSPYTLFSGTITLNSSGQSYALPTGRGTNGQVLQTNGGGSTSWANMPQTASIKYLICINGLFPSSGSDITEHFIGEIIPFAGVSQLIPSNFMECKGQTLQIMSYQALYAVIGITYGGNGSTTFMLPNLTAKVIAGQ